MQVFPTCRTSSPAISLLRRSTRANFGGAGNKAVTIRSNFAFSSLWLAPRLSDFQLQHPDVSLHIVPALWESDYRKNSEGIEIRFGTGDWTREKTILFDKLACYPVASPNVAQSINSDTEIGNAPLIAVPGMMAQWSDFFNFIKVPENNRHTMLATPSFNIALEMATLGMGLVLGHDTVCQQYLDSGTLVRVSAGSIEMQERYYMVYDQQELSPPERAFVSWLEKILPG